jgi:hypothetical protein
MAPRNAPVGASSFLEIWRFSINLTEIRLRPAPPSTNILVTRMLQITGDTTRGSVPTPEWGSG